MKKENPQNRLILEHLYNEGSITQMEAVNLFNCYRLSARIYDLRERGNNIKTVYITKNHKTFARYILRD
jgi:hypothetical protein